MVLAELPVARHVEAHLKGIGGFDLGALLASFVLGFL